MTKTRCNNHYLTDTTLFTCTPLRTHMPTPLDYAWMLLKQWDDLPENWGQPPTSQPSDDPEGHHPPWSEVAAAGWESEGGMSATPSTSPNMQHPGLAGGRALQLPTALQQQAMKRYNHKPNSLPYHPLPSFKQTRPELHAHDHPDHHEQPRSRFAPTPLPPYQTRSGGVRGVHPDAGGVDWENEL
mgnify:CR=1 FL=1